MKEDVDELLEITLNFIHCKLISDIGQLQIRFYQ